MFYLGGITFGYLQPPTPAPQAQDAVDASEPARKSEPKVDIAGEPRKSADSTPFLWVRQWMM